MTRMFLTTRPLNKHNPLGKFLRKLPPQELKQTTVVQNTRKDKKKNGYEPMSRGMSCILKKGKFVCSIKNDFRQ